MRAVEQFFYVVMFVFNFYQVELFTKFGQFLPPVALLGVQWLRLNIVGIKTQCKEFYLVYIK